MRAEQDIRRLLAAADPVRDHPVPPVPVFDPPAPVHRRRRVLVAAALVAVVAAGAAVWTVARPNAPRGAAATPPLLSITAATDTRPAPVLLEEIAARAQRSGVPTGRPGGTEHFQMQAWYLHAQVQRGDTRSVLQATYTELWWNADGSGRIDTRDSPPQFQSEADQRAWASETDGEGDSSSFEPHERTRMWPDRPPTDPAELALWLEINHPRANGPTEVIASITDLVRQRVLTADERAAVLRVLATVPGLRHDGTTHDRTGRPGMVFSLDSNGHGLPTRYSLVIDPGTGLILAREEVLTKDPGALGVTIPAVITSEVYVRQDFQGTP
ncbi:CU044_5270 family protein [Actinokineospora globicatena]|uniref:CU044_5270 family protein n=1 Tax=Actinokineospora globicatena TaxID=103729 RepID=UPI0020A26C59|nr:CU044_5270 family protein [Actinokineospora globicatena]MCP2306767.1 hypothetical protein [Actinokineospora globicatena]GLW82113.1 hypothetical protein Aglo01_65940 [Actinokineospora globicatena]GLW88906.1 hypothetical protein Aglo02_65450 [Actinokineospora globicatena]